MDGLTTIKTWFRNNMAMPCGSLVDMIVRSRFSLTRELELIRNEDQVKKIMVKGEDFNRIVISVAIFLVLYVQFDPKRFLPARKISPVNVDYVLMLFRV